MPDPEAATSTPYDVTLRATDPAGLEGTTTFRWTVAPAPGAPELASLKVNFQDPAATPPADHVTDYGKPFGARTAPEQGAAAVDGLRYGWVRVDEEGRTVTRFPLDLSVGGSANAGNGRVRTAAGVDLRLRTLMHMQGDDVQAFEAAKTPPGSFNGTPAEGAFEVAVADGVYDVTVGAGDTNALITGGAPEKHFLRVEGRSACRRQFVPPAAGGIGRTKVATVSGVQVTDGRLTIDAIGGVNTKILFAELTRIQNEAPAVAAIADRSDRAGDAIELAPSATDADGDALVWSATGLPAGLAIDAATGRITGTIGRAPRRRTRTTWRSRRPTTAPRR